MTREDLTITKHYYDSRKADESLSMGEYPSLATELPDTDFALVVFPTDEGYSIIVERTN